MSSSPCVGWAWRPSPALITCTWGATCCAIRYGAPDSLCRTTNRSAAMADRLAMVSSSDSPLLAELRAMSRLITSADRRLAAISNVVRVRVLFSKNRLNTLLPRSRGTFFTSRSFTLTKLAAVSRMCVTMSRGRPSMESRWISSPFLLSWGLRLCSTVRPPGLGTGKCPAHCVPGPATGCRATPRGQRQSRPARAIRAHPGPPTRPGERWRDDRSQTAR